MEKSVPGKCGRPRWVDEVTVRPTLSPSRPSSPSCHTPILMAKDLRIAQTSSADITMRCLEKPVAPQSTRRSWLCWGGIFIRAHSGLCVRFLYPIWL